MTPGNRKASSKEEKRESRKAFYTEPKIEELATEFDLSGETEDAATVIYRILSGLGKGLSSSQRKSYSAISVWFAAKYTGDKKPLKEELAEAVDLSPRTLSRRFQEVEDDEKCIKILDHVRNRIKEWSRNKRRKLRDML